MVKYDPRIIRSFAEQMYNRADLTVFVYAAAGVLIGFIGGAIGGSSGRGLLGAILAGGIGFFVGSQKAFWLKLQAQLALCQVTIEENSRASAGSAIHPAVNVPAIASAPAVDAPASAGPSVASGPTYTCSGCGRAVPAREAVQFLGRIWCPEDYARQL